MGDIVSNICRVLGVEHISSAQGDEIDRLIAEEISARMADADAAGDGECPPIRCGTFEPVEGKVVWSGRHKQRLQLAAAALPTAMILRTTDAGHGDPVRGISTMSFPRMLTPAEAATEAVRYADAVLAELERMK